MLHKSDRDDYLTERETDPDLTPVGIEQAKRVADFLAKQGDGNGNDPQNRQGFGLTHLYCSLMVRAVKTGHAISKMTGLQLIARPEVHETGGIFDSKIVNGEPVFEGRPGPGRSFFTSEFPELILPDDLSEIGWWDREKESREEYPIRARQIIDNLLSEHGGKDDRVAIVMHGGIFARILTEMFDIKAERYWFLMNNCAISRVDVGENGRFMLAYMNKVEHLPDHLIT